VGIVSALDDEIINIIEEFFGGIESASLNELLIYFGDETKSTNSSALQMELVLFLQ
jgi:hypothetical protein